MSKNVLLFSVFDRSWCVVFSTDINLASLVKQFSGRKRGSSVWTYFKFEETENKSRCLVALANGSKCVGLDVAEVGNGAGYHSPQNWVTYNAVCESACLKAIEVLKIENNALDAAVAAVTYLENSKWSNAGIGSNLSLTGKVECDASIMDGETLLYGAVGAVPGVKNPIKLAESLLKVQKDGDMSLGRVPPCMLVGSGAHRWAVKHDIEVVKDEELITESSRKSFLRNKRKLEILGEVSDEDDYQPNKKMKLEPEVHVVADLNSQPELDSEVILDESSQETVSDEIATEKRLDTVGAVCVDGQGRVASAVSSGGILLKQPGRIGQNIFYALRPGDKDLARFESELIEQKQISILVSGAQNSTKQTIYGCGCWAENSIENNIGVAVSTSGCGEHLIKTFLAKECGESLKQCDNAVSCLINCFNTKFIGSRFLKNVSESMGGALALKVTQSSAENLCVEFQWVHSTESMSIGFMSTSDFAPQAQVSKLGAGSQSGKSFLIGGHTCYIPIVHLT